MSGNILINDGGTGELSFVMWGVVCESLSVYRVVRSPNADAGGRVGVGSGLDRFGPGVSGDTVGKIPLKKSKNHGTFPALPCPTMRNRCKPAS